MICLLWSTYLRPVSNFMRVMEFLEDLLRSFDLDKCSQRWLPVLPLCPDWCCRLLWASFLDVLCEPQHSQSTKITDQAQHWHYTSVLTSALRDNSSAFTEAIFHDYFDLLDAVQSVEVSEEGQVMVFSKDYYAGLSWHLKIKEASVVWSQKGFVTILLLWYTRAMWCALEL